MSEYGVVVIGGGHAGAEAVYFAAKIAAKNGQKVALVTLREDNLGQMSCNPAIGGIGKGVIVKEIDAMGGLMGLAIDRSSIHSKMLNQTKGAAVWGPRAQADRELYQKAVYEIVSGVENIDIIVDSAEDLLIENSAVKAVIMASGRVIATSAVVLTTGTFLSGKILIGESTIPAGRIGENPSYGLSKTLGKYNFSLGRLKTGTPARILKNSINWGILEKQEGDTPPVQFSVLTEAIETKQIDCYITATNQKTHDIILKNADKSPALLKKFEGFGPRYCPSIEDKIVRFSERSSHRIFLEPEGLTSDWVYPNGISTSMPEEIQEQYIRTIKGLEEAQIARFGYAIEYDFVNPQELKPTLETKKISGLFFAGQINGTTGYEEAAGQGLVAGINAGLVAFKADFDFTISRAEAYIGVMIDDLTTKGVSEPYRVFTSRAEYRLSIRADNADFRLSERAISLGLLSDEQVRRFEYKKNRSCQVKQALEAVKLSPNELEKYGVIINKDGIKRTPLELLTSPVITKSDIEKIVPEMLDFEQDILNYIITEAKYKPYLEQQSQDIKMLNRGDEVQIPADLNYAEIGSLSKEVCEILAKSRPTTIGQASRIQGITPASLVALMVYLKSYLKT
jgi:tRNA uridine 5-carboxymethylaminomethyl modification enzyme